MACVVIRPRARIDLAEIWDFIAEDSEAQADAFIDDLDAKFQTLAQNPLIGRARSELAPDLRSFPIGRYIIFYEPLTDGVAVGRVLHSARDIDAQFSQQEKRPS